ncbi:MAG: cell division protein FtsL [Deltaproteobacteria bacterium]|nr:cell division protein FtsL [Deltaproteobacteria bacterium]
MKRRAKSSAKRARVLPALLATAVVLVGFAMLMVRLEVIQEGYRLSALRLEVEKLQQENQRLRLEAAELSSYRRLRSLAPKYGLRPPAPGQIVMMR